MPRQNGKILITDLFIYARVQICLSCSFLASSGCYFSFSVILFSLSLPSYNLSPLTECKKYVIERFSTWLDVKRFVMIKVLTRKLVNISRGKSANQIVRN